MSTPSNLAKWAQQEEPGVREEYRKPGVQWAATLHKGYWTPLARGAQALDDALHEFSPEYRLKFLRELVEAMKRDIRALERSEARRLRAA